MSDPHKGSCFCGAVQFEVSGTPAAMGICHCESCRIWSAGPVNSFALWPRDVVKITAGADLIGTRRIPAKAWIQRNRPRALFGGYTHLIQVPVIARLE